MNYSKLLGFLSLVAGLSLGFAAKLTAQIPASAATPPAEKSLSEIPIVGISVDAKRGVVIRDPYKPAYPTPYAPASVEEISEVMNRVRNYLEAASPLKLLERESGNEITDFSVKHPGAVVSKGDFLQVSYEWGVTYAGMLHAGLATGDVRFTDFTVSRLRFLMQLAPLYREEVMALPLPGLAKVPAQKGPYRFDRSNPATLFRSLLNPHSLDDSGAMAVAMIKAEQLQVAGDLRPQIERYLKWISEGQYRLPDGTLARKRPMPNTLWLDDMFMSIPALAHMGKLTGEHRYFDDAVKQVQQFSSRMFVKDKGLFMHGWVQGMETHPAFHWARANGWALMAMTELLDVLPEDHPGRPQVLMLLKAHIAGLAACQASDGYWHQLLDRSDSYTETSATAIYVYCIAKAINRGWIDLLAHGPMVSLAWNAVARRVNEKGQVEGTCVGTGMGFDPAFYYYRPCSPTAAHGYGPVLLAGAEMIVLRKGKGADANVNDGGLHFSSGAPLF